MDREEIKKAFELYDTNNDGFINLQGFIFLNFYLFINI
jgi:Ca2+-binding EF-hand superfamily protein